MRQHYVSTSSEVEINQLSDNLWTIEGNTISFVVPPFPLAFPYTLRTVIVRVADGSLWIHSPIEFNQKIKNTVDKLGPVRYIVSPNKLHHLYMGEWGEQYPNAKLYASPGLPQKRPDLKFETVLTETPEPEWAQDLDQCIFKGSIFMEEVVFFHRPSATLIIGDIIENHDPNNFNAIQRFIASKNKMLAPKGETPFNFRLTIWKRTLARATIEKMLSWKPQQLILMHGPCVTEDVDQFLRRGFKWLL